jgi:hypothetical protein
MYPAPYIARNEKVGVSTPLSDSNEKCPHRGHFFCGVTAALLAVNFQA